MKAMEEEAAAAKSENGNGDGGSEAAVVAAATGSTEAPMGMLERLRKKVYWCLPRNTVKCYCIALKGAHLTLHPPPPHLPLLSFTRYSQSQRSGCSLSPSFVSI